VQGPEFNPSTSKKKKKPGKGARIPSYSGDTLGRSRFEASRGKKFTKFAFQPIKKLNFKKRKEIAAIPQKHAPFCETSQPLQMCPFPQSL
jgi:hypothetical protein